MEKEGRLNLGYPLLFFSLSSSIPSPNPALPLHRLFLASSKTGQSKSWGRAEVAVAWQTGFPEVPPSQQVEPFPLGLQDLGLLGWKCKGVCTVKSPASQNFRERSMHQILSISSELIKSGVMAICDVCISLKNVWWTHRLIGFSYQQHPVRQLGCPKSQVNSTTGQGYIWM